MRTILCWEADVVPDEESLVQTLEAAGHEVHFARELEVLPRLLPDDPDEPAVLLGYVDYSASMEDYNRRMRALYAAYLPLHEGRLVGVTVVATPGPIFVSLPRFCFAVLTLPINMEKLNDFIARFEKTLKAEEGRDAIRRQGAL